MRIVIGYCPADVMLSLGIPTMTFGARELFAFAFNEFVFPNARDEDVLEYLFALFNGQGEPQHDHLWVLYKFAKMPSLSVGMTVELDGRGYLCTTHGWVRV